VLSAATSLPSEPSGPSKTSSLSLLTRGRVGSFGGGFVGGQERVEWKPEYTVPVGEFELPDSEAVRIRAAVETWDSYSVNADRGWLEPALNALALHKPL